MIANLLPLCRLPAGAIGRVRSLTGTGELALRVRELGFSESALVRKVAGSGPFICQLHETRMILSHDVAASIIVEPLSPAPANTARSA